MAMWDSALLAYADRSRVIPPEYRQLVIRRNSDVLPTLLVDREPAVYGRYAHWWSTLPSAEVRVLPSGHQPLTAS